MSNTAIMILRGLGVVWASAVVAGVAYILRWMKKNEAEYQKCRKECERGVRQDNHA